MPERRNRAATPPGSGRRRGATPSESSAGTALLVAAMEGQGGLRQAGNAPDQGILGSRRDEWHVRDGGDATGPSSGCREGMEREGETVFSREGVTRQIVQARLSGSAAMRTIRGSERRSNGGPTRGASPCWPGRDRVDQWGLPVSGGQAMRLRVGRRFAVMWAAHVTGPGARQPPGAFAQNLVSFALPRLWAT